MAGSGAYYLEDMEGKTASPALECEQFEKKIPPPSATIMMECRTLYISLEEMEQK